MPWSHNKNYSRLSPVWLHLGDRSVSWIPEKHLETFGNVWGFWITDIMVHPLLWWDSEHYAWCEVASWPDCWLVGEGGGRTLLPPLPLGEFYYDPWVRARACLGQWCYIVVSQLWLGARRGRTCRMVIIAPTTTAFLLSLHLSLVYTNTRLARDSGSNVPRDLVTGNTSPSAQSDISHLSSYLPVSTSPVFCKQSEINIPGTAGSFSPAGLIWIMICWAAIPWILWSWCCYLETNLTFYRQNQNLNFNPGATQSVLTQRWNGSDWNFRWVISDYCFVFWVIWYVLCWGYCYV